VNDLYPEINVGAQEKDKASVLNFYRRMLAVRQEHKSSLIFGEFELLEADNTSTFHYLKKGDKETLGIALNFTGEEQPLSLPGKVGKMVLSSSSEEGQGDKLRPYEGRVYVITR